MKPYSVILFALLTATAARAADDPARTQTLLAPTAEVLEPGQFRLSFTDFVFYHVEAGVAPQWQAGATLAPPGVIADAKYQYRATDSTQLAMFAVGGIGFEGKPALALAHVATFSPSIFQINTALGIGTFGGTLDFPGSLGAAIQLGDHVKLLTEASVDLTYLTSGHTYVEGFGLGGLRYFRESFSVDAGLALYSDILYGADYFPMFPWLSFSFRP